MTYSTLTTLEREHLLSPFTDEKLRHRDVNATF